MIQDLVSRLTTLEERFDSEPPDLKEQRCRNDVMRYAFGPLLCLVLSSSQKVGGYRTTTAIVVYEAEVATTH